MKLREVTGWKQHELDLTSLEGAVDEDVLFGIVKEQDLIITFFGKDLDKILQQDVAQQIDKRLEVDIKQQDGTLGSGSKKLSKLFYDPIRKQLLGRSMTRVEVHWNKPRPGVAPSSTAGFYHWFLVSKGSSVILTKEHEPTAEKLHDMEQEGLINLRGYGGSGMWEET